MKQTLERSVSKTLTKRKKERRKSQRSLSTCSTMESQAGRNENRQIGSQNRDLHRPLRTSTTSVEERLHILMKKRFNALQRWINNWIRQLKKEEVQSQQRSQKSRNVVTSVSVGKATMSKKSANFERKKQQATVRQAVCVQEPIRKKETRNIGTSTRRSFREGHDSQFFFNNCRQEVQKKVQIHNQSLEQSQVRSALQIKYIDDERYIVDYVINFFRRACSDLNLACIMTLLNFNSFIEKITTEISDHFHLVQIKNQQQSEGLQNDERERVEATFINSLCAKFQQFWKLKQAVIIAQSYQFQSQWGSISEEITTYSKKFVDRQLFSKNSIVTSSLNEIVLIVLEILKKLFVTNMRSLRDVFEDLKKSSKDQFYFTFDEQKQNYDQQQRLKEWKNGLHRNCEENVQQVEKVTRHFALKAETTISFDLENNFSVRSCGEENQGERLRE